jgi:hypothetical protein
LTISSGYGVNGCGRGFDRARAGFMKPPTL